MNEQHVTYAVYGMAGLSSLVAVGSITNGFDQVCASNKSARDWKNVNMMLAGGILACSAARSTTPVSRLRRSAQKIVTLGFFASSSSRLPLFNVSAGQGIKATGFSLATSITFRPSFWWCRGRVCRQKKTVLE